MTRDSRWWWVGIALALIGGFTGNMNLLQDAMPSLTPEKMKQINAWLQILALTFGIVSAKMSMSPLPISAQGRVDALAKNADNATAAQKAANVAVVASTETANWSKVAADASADAADKSNKASGVQD